jgi:hypothetical protein
MKRFDDIYKRIKRLEPQPSTITPWPPVPGTMEHCMWMDIGRPIERMEFFEMLEAKASQVFA